MTPAELDILAKAIADRLDSPLARANRQFNKWVEQNLYAGRQVVQPPQPVPPSPGLYDRLMKGFEK